MTFDRKIVDPGECQEEEVSLQEEKVEIMEVGVCREEEVAQ